MALTVAGQTALLNYMRDNFVKMSVGGTYTVNGVPAGEFNLPVKAAGTPTIGAANINWDDQIVFDIDLSDHVVSFPLGNGYTVVATVTYVTLWDAAGTTELLRRSFSGTYIYSGNGTYTVTSVYVALL